MKKCIMLSKISIIYEMILCLLFYLVLNPLGISAIKYLKKKIYFNGKKQIYKFSMNVAVSDVDWGNFYPNLGF